MPPKTMQGVKESCLDTTQLPKTGEETKGFHSWKPMALSTGACALFGILGVSFSGFNESPHFSLVFFSLAYVTGGWEATLEALRALKKATLEVDLLMVLAAVGAAILDHWAEGAVLLFLFSLGNTLETFAFGRTRRSIQALMDLSPASASKLDGDMEVQVGIGDLLPGDLIRVRPGERIPLDGAVIAGESPVNESTLTGEAVPLSLIHISEPTRLKTRSRMPSSA